MGHTVYIYHERVYERIKKTFCYKTGYFSFLKRFDLMTYAHSATIVILASERLPKPRSHQLWPFATRPGPGCLSFVDFWIYYLVLWTIIGGDFNCSFTKGARETGTSSRDNLH